MISGRGDRTVTVRRFAAGTVDEIVEAFRTGLVSALPPEVD